MAGVAARSVHCRLAAATIVVITVAAATGVAVASSSPAARPAGWSQVRTFRGPVWDIANQEAQALLHFHAGRWTQISAPRGALFRSPGMAADGASGVWLGVTAPASSRTVLYDYRRGHWSKAAVFAAPGRYTLIAALVRVPGTGRAFAGGYAGHTTGTPRTYGVLYQFRR